MLNLKSQDAEASSVKAYDTGGGSRSISLNNVLIVEDEYLIADDVARAFLSIGCLDVEMAVDIPDALSSIRRRCPDGAVLDLNLQNKMAFVVADVLLLKHVPFVFMTGHEPSVIPLRFNGVVRCEKPTAPLQVAKALLRIAGNGTKAALHSRAHGRHGGS